MVTATAIRDSGLAKYVSRGVMRHRRPHGLILSYHRIAAPSWDPWAVCVSPKRFEQQLAVLSRRADLVPLSALGSRLRAGRRGRPVIALTFDDGYADNLHNALPLLERYNIPATIFIATGWTDRGEPFWWDRLIAIVLSIDPLPPRISVHVGDEEFTWRRNMKARNHRRERDQLHLAVWSRLVAATDDEREVALNQLQSYGNSEPEVDPATRPMTREELRRLATSPLIEIGAHTISHCSLPDLAPEAQFEEIQGSRRQCRELTGQLPSSFAYPFGNLDARTPELVRSAGFERACSTEKEIVWDGADEMLLPRITMFNWTTRDFSAHLRFVWLP
jgi:peptidoglycan/xylan/chitin deacetylase (PgdA/CDA1 family)